MPVLSLNLPVPGVVYIDATAVLFHGLLGSKADLVRFPGIKGRFERHFPVGNAPDEIPPHPRDVMPEPRSASGRKVLSGPVRKHTEPSNAADSP